MLRISNLVSVGLNALSGRYVGLTQREMCGLPPKGTMKGEERGAMRPFPAKAPNENRERKTPPTKVTKCSKS